jgi:hypothetical protein
LSSVERGSLTVFRAYGQRIAGRLRHADGCFIEEAGGGKGRARSC